MTENKVQNLNMVNYKNAVERNVFNNFLMQANRITPNKPNAKLLKNSNIASDAFFAVKDTACDVMNFTDAIVDGKSNDNKLGRLNDLGLKLGGAMIAACLWGQRPGKTSKVMEVVGLGTFLSSMYLWPKLFISTPLKMRYGFDIDRKYIDNQGTKKKFFTDNQYLPWDVWDKKEIEKIANKMNVPKDIKDREEYTKKKMQKIALQGNTLSMLTAGFATPIMTSLICDKLEKNIEKANTINTIKRGIKKLDNTLLKNDEYLLTGEEVQKIGKDIESILDNSKDDYLDEICSKLLKGYEKDDVVKGAIKADIENILSSSKTLDKDALANKLYKLLDGNEIKTITEDGEIEVIGKLELDKIKQILKNVNDNSADFYNDILNAFKNEEGAIGNYEDFAKKLKEALSSKKVLKINSEKASEGIKNAWSSGLGVFSKKYLALKGMTDSLSAESADSIATADYKAIINEFLHQMKLSGKELDVVRNGGAKAQDTMIKVLQEKASDEAVFKNFILDILSNRTKYSKETNANMEHLQSRLSSFMEYYKNSFEGKNLENLNSLFKSAEGGSNKNQIFAQLETKIKSANFNLDGVTARLLAGADFERKLVEETTKKEIEKCAKECGVDFKEYVKICRKLIYSDNMNSFVQKNAIESQKLYKSVIETVFGGKMSEAAKNAIESENGKLINRMLEINMSNGEANTVDIFNTVKRRIYDIAGSIRAWGKDDHVIEGTYSDLNDVLKYKAVGTPLTELLQESAKNAFNHHKWFKTFGLAFVALAGITLIAGRFFGKIKDEHLYKKEHKGVNK